MTISVNVFLLFRSDRLLFIMWFIHLMEE